MYHKIQIEHEPFIVTLSAPSGCGKSSLIQALLRSDSKLRLSISVTTRSPRDQEIEGEHYHFKSLTEFQELIKRDKFLEYASIYGNYYGTLKDEVDKILYDGYDLLFDIDWHGTKSIKAQRPDAVSVFLLPPDHDSLKDRLIFRGKDSEDSIRRRLSSASQEIANAKYYDYVLINQSFDFTILQLDAILSATRIKNAKSHNINFVCKGTNV